MSNNEKVREEIANLIDIGGISEEVADAILAIDKLRVEAENQETDITDIAQMFYRFRRVFTKGLTEEQEAENYAKRLSARLRADGFVKVGKK